MDKYTEKLSQILSNIDGGCDSVFCGMDGIVIARHTLIKNPLDVELICANYVTVIKTLKSTGNIPKDIITSFEKYTIFIKILDDGFLAIIMNLDGNLGRAKLECSKIKNFE